MPVCPYCGRELSSLTNVSYDAVTTHRYYGFGDFQLEDLGDKRLNYQLKKYFGSFYRDLREEIFKRCKEGDYGLLIDVSLFLKRRLGLAPNLYLPRIRMTAKREEEIKKFWDESSLSSATFVHRKNNFSTSFLSIKFRDKFALTQFKFGAS